MDLFRGTKKVFWMLAGLIALGIIVFHAFAGFSLINSYYFVITILTTVGFGDLNLLEASPAVKLFGTVMMVSGVAVMTLVYSIVANHIISDRLENMLGRSRIKMKNHTILIGWNKTALATLDELKKISEVVIITRDEKILNEVNDRKIKVIIGDGTEDGVLEKANLKDAKNVITCDSDDSRNVMTTLMVRKLNRKVKIISSANERVNMQIIKEAGADEVISPDVIGGRLLTSAIFEPSVVEMIKDATYVGEGTNIEEITLSINASVKFITDRFQISVLEKVSKGRRYPDLKTTDMISKGETIVVFGYIKNIRKASGFLAGKKK